MYTRPYFQNSAEVSVPEKYDGNALKEETANKSGDDEVRSTESEEMNEELRAPWDRIESEANEQTVKTGADVDSKRGILGGLMKNLPFGSLPFKLNFMGSDGFKLGYEEILIIAIALFLIFSKGGDKECGIALLALIFIT